MFVILAWVCWFCLVVVWLGGWVLLIGLYMVWLMCFDDCLGGGSCCGFGFGVFGVWCWLFVSLVGFVIYYV